MGLHKYLPVAMEISQVLKEVVVILKWCADARVYGGVDVGASPHEEMAVRHSYFFPVKLKICYLIPYVACQFDLQQNNHQFNGQK